MTFESVRMFSFYASRYFLFGRSDVAFIWALRQFECFSFSEKCIENLIKSTSRYSPFGRTRSDVSFFNDLWVSSCVFSLSEKCIGNNYISFFNVLSKKNVPKGRKDNKKPIVAF